MSVVVLMSQPLREKQAAAFLRSRREGEAKVVLTRDTSVLDAAAFPPGTELVGWDVGGVRLPRTLSNRLITRASSWVRRSSWPGMAIDRWLRGAEWRLRYLDRVLALFRSDLSPSGLDHPLVKEALRELATGRQLDEIATFDLFDLPAALGVAEWHRCEVTVR